LQRGPGPVSVGRKFIRASGENLFEPSGARHSPSSGSAVAAKLWRTQSNESSPKTHPPRRIAPTNHRVNKISPDRVISFLRIRAYSTCCNDGQGTTFAGGWPALRLIPRLVRDEVSFGQACHSESIAAPSTTQPGEIAFLRILLRGSLQLTCGDMPVIYETMH
jgi:hypothetical protein